MARFMKDMEGKTIEERAQAFGALHDDEKPIAVATMNAEDRAK